MNRKYKKPQLPFGRCGFLYLRLEVPCSTHGLLDAADDCRRRHVFPNDGFLNAGELMLQQIHHFVHLRQKKRMRVNKHPKFSTGSKHLMSGLEQIV
jgi:hypothetical protein